MRDKYIEWPIFKLCCATGDYRSHDSAGIIDRKRRLAKPQFGISWEAALWSWGRQKSLGCCGNPLDTISMGRLELTRRWAQTPHLRPWKPLTEAWRRCREQRKQRFLRASSRVSTCDKLLKLYRTWAANPACKPRQYLCPQRRRESAAF